MEDEDEKERVKEILGCNDDDDGDGRTGGSSWDRGTGSPLPPVYSNVDSLQLAMAVRRPQSCYYSTPFVRSRYWSFAVLFRLRSRIHRILRYPHAWELPNHACVQRHCGIITFVYAFAMLLTCHVKYMSGEKLNTMSSQHSTGAMMVLTLKVTSAAMNYQDGLIKDKDSLQNSQKNCRLDELPSPIAFIGYCLNCGTHLAGPVFEIKDYLDWTENKGLWSSTAAMPPPSPYKFALAAVLKALACIGIYIYLMNYVAIQQLSDAEYLRWGIWNRIGFQYLCAFTARWKYYIVWSLSEASMIISGFGFSSWIKASPSEEPQPKWTRAKNVDILRVELPRSAVEIPLYWNIHVGIWLRHYVYERLTRKGEKPGFIQLLATQVTSAVWHGLYPGYMVFFVNTIFMIAGARVLYRWQKLIPEKAAVARLLATFVNGIYTVVVLNLTSIAFLLLDYAHTMAAYRSVYYIGTWIPLLVMVLGSVIKVPSTERNQSTKKEK